MLTFDEIDAWCKEKFDEPEKIIAVLHNLDVIDVDESMFKTVEDLEKNVEYSYYHARIDNVEIRIFDEHELEVEHEEWKKDQESYLLEDVPNTIRDYINWDRYWCDNENIYTDLGIDCEVFHNGEFYYLSVL